MTFMQSFLRQTVVPISLSLSCLGLQAQMNSSAGTKPPGSAKQPLYYVDATVLDLSLVLPSPPPQDSSVTEAEIAEIRRIEQSRTPEQIAAARVDDKEEDIFIYKNILGGAFVPDELPQTRLLSAHILSDQSVLGLPTKIRFGRPRPYLYKNDLRPVCAVPTTPAYPSGHAFSGYLFAFALIQIVPEKKDDILRRADEYGNNRMICGAHYKSDIAASHDAALVVFGYMLANPRFAKELEAARAETRHRLGMTLNPATESKKMP
ncbi:MAG TPA: phosphatase PAP2 family protein [Edaphobacter sp.]|nr:phosphatase PAP2 family protein [Edaphobacter sp.]